jgi:glyceraldehyde 3-phosphate dehydrogenase
MEQRFILSRQTDLKKIILFDIHNALVIDNTGAFTTHEALSRHLVSKLIKYCLPLPEKSSKYCTWRNSLQPDEINIFSAASCTTNAITPILKAVEDTLGRCQRTFGNHPCVYERPKSWWITCKKNRRGRAAALNMVLPKQALEVLLPNYRH